MKKVLVVEDDAFIRDISTIKLTQHGYEVVAVADGVTAKETLNSVAFDVVLLDQELPDMSGLAILKEMRSSERHKKTPVIIFSNRDDEGLQNELKKLGISGYFVKASTEFTEVFACIDSL